ncbi:TasA family protein [Haloplanus sp. GCM10025708]|uniref:TasA family protein n=1 Tax=Haloferacaceae TaxID=1644056 RepID=UPI00361AC95D
MSEDSHPLSRRKALAALTTIGVGSAAVGAGTFAAFSDTETSSSSLSTESITLDKGTQTLSFQSGSIEPGDSGSSSVVVTSTGTAGGQLSVAIASVDNTDVASTTPEEDAEGGTNVPLSEALEIKMWVEEASVSSGTEGQFDPSYDYGLKSDGSVANGSGASLSFAPVAQYPTTTSYSTATFADSSSTDKEFYVKWQLPQSATNAVQRDETTVNFDLTLNQV